MTEFSMPYTFALAPAQPMTTEFYEYCPKCKKKQRVIYAYQMTNAYGCYDGTCSFQLSCGHFIMPWEKIKEEKEKESETK